jgi:hypothetical protein
MAMEAQVQALARLLGTLGALHDLLGDRLAQANPEAMARLDRLALSNQLHRLCSGGEWGR